ncbi:Alpha/Beta hydrolase protein [Sporodiniella umbellata]|nr:Alpha/Beta hydrolase protein [Sporodiniella umbellata]
MSLSSVREKGYVGVAQGRAKVPVNLYYELHGKGDEHVVLIMGLNASCLAWEHQTRYLSETERYTVLIFENRGMGLSDAPWGMYSTSEMALDVMDLLDHFGWKKNVHVCGVSMGGMIALEMVSQWPSRFSSLVLTSTRAGRQLPPLKGITNLVKLLCIRDPTHRVQMGLNLVYPAHWLAAKPTSVEYQQYDTNADLSLALFLARMDRSRAQSLMGSLSQMAAGLRHHVSDARLRAIRETRVPVLVMTGTVDHLVDPANSYHLADILQAKLVVFEGSGHGLPSEQTDRYNTLIDQHFTNSRLA